MAGIALLAMGRLGVTLLKCLPLGVVLRQTWIALSPIPFSGTAFAAFVLGLAAPYIANFLPIGGLKAARDHAINRHGTDLDRLLNRAINSERKISFTLNNRKWYVGYVTRAPNLSPHEQYVSILPILSGCRNEATLETEITTDYVPIFESGVERNDFAVTLPLSAITSASFFDESVYAQFGENRELADREILDESSI